MYAIYVNGEHTLPYVRDFYVRHLRHAITGNIPVIIHVRPGIYDDLYRDASTLQRDILQGVPRDRIGNGNIGEYALYPRVRFKLCGDVDIGQYEWTCILTNITQKSVAYIVMKDIIRCCDLYTTIVYVDDSDTELLRMCEVLQQHDDHGAFPHVMG